MLISIVFTLNIIYKDNTIFPVFTLNVIYKDNINNQCTLNLLNNKCLRCYKYLIFKPFEIYKKELLFHMNTLQNI